jgi:hypothetical protein
MTQQLDCLRKLQQHLLCDTHSSARKRVFCLIKKSEGDGRGGHYELTHGEMTLWAKQMVSHAKSSATRHSLVSSRSETRRYSPRRITAILIIQLQKNLGPYPQSPRYTCPSISCLHQEQGALRCRRRTLSRIPHPPFQLHQDLLRKARYCRRPYPRVPQCKQYTWPQVPSRRSPLQVNRLLRLVRNPRAPYHQVHHPVRQDLHPYRAS